MSQRPRAIPCLTNRSRFFPRFSATLLAAERIPILQLTLNMPVSPCQEFCIPQKEWRDLLLRLDGKI
jgi:hypothetical protein